MLPPAGLWLQLQAEAVKLFQPLSLVSFQHRHLFLSFYVESNVKSLGL